MKTLLKTLQTTPVHNEANLADDEEDFENQLEGTQENQLKGTQLAQASYKARKIIAKIQSSHRLWESLKAQAQAARIPPKRPILDMPVHWNSTHAMLERILELRPTIDAVCKLEEHLRSLQIHTDEWSLLQKLKRYSRCLY